MGATMPDKDSPFWPILSLTLRASVVMTCLIVFYNKVDVRDMYTMITFIFADGAITKAISMAKPNS